MYGPENAYTKFCLYSLKKIYICTNTTLAVIAFHFILKKINLKHA